MSERGIGLIYASVAAFCWALLAIGLKYCLGFASPGTIVWFRMSVAFVLLSIFFIIKSPSQLKIVKSFPLLGLFAGVCLSINYFGYMKGVELTSPSNAQIMIQMAPMMLILIGVLYFKERPNKIQIIGFFIALLGFSLFFKDQITQVLERKENFITGNYWILLASITWAIFATFQKILSKNWSPQQINLLIYLVSSIGLFFLTDLSELKTASFTQIFWLIFMGVNTLIAYGSLGEALKRAPASQVSMIITLNPLLTISIMTYFRYQDVRWIQVDVVQWLGYLGSIIVVIGVLLTIKSQNKNKTVQP